MSYWFDVWLDSLYCEDPESLHSNDKFALSGAVSTDLEAAGFVMPTIRPPENQHSFFPQDLVHLFSDRSSVPRFLLDLHAWDLDENDGWVDNREDIVKASKAIAQGVKAVPGWGMAVGVALDVINKVVPPIIDQFVSWDKNDPLLNYTRWVDMPTLTPNVPFHMPLAVHFFKEDDTGYSDYDYTLHFRITCTWVPDVSPLGTLPAGPASKHLYQDSIPKTWFGAWDGEGVQVGIRPSEVSGYPQDPDAQYLRVDVTENIDGLPVDTVTEYTPISRLFLEFLEPVQNEELWRFAQLVNAQKDGPGVVSRLGLPGKEFASLLPNEGKAKLPPKQYEGDYLKLNNDATLEIYQLRHDGKVVGEALRYRRPSAAFLGFTASTSTDVMLYRRTV